jgi:hypothetical protein
VRPRKASNHNRAHSELVHATRLALGREPDFTLWCNSKVMVVNGEPHAAPGLTTGASDLLGILAPLGRIVALEAKTGKAVATPEQERFMALVRKRGGFAAVFHSVDEAKEALIRARQGLCE